MGNGRGRGGGSTQQNFIMGDPVSSFQSLPIKSPIPFSIENATISRANRKKNTITVFCTSYCETPSSQLSKIFVAREKYPFRDNPL